MDKDAKQKIRGLKKEIREYAGKTGSSREIQLLEYALADIETYYRDQVRVSGDPAVMHSLRIGRLLCRFGAGLQTVIAGLLHDLLEDTEITSNAIRRRYGAWYAKAVEALSKERSIFQTHQKLLRAGMNDVRFLIVKTFDRLDNLRDLHWLPKHKRSRIAGETKSFYLPIAKSIGISPAVINEMTDRSNQYLT